jgi:hypothetical protein
MRTAASIIAVVALLVAPVQATLVLNDDFPVVPLLVAPGGTSSTITLSVAEDSSPTDNVTAFQVGLDIVPNGVTTGTLTFATPTTSAASPEPPNYIFTVTPNQGLNVQNPGAAGLELFVSDFNNPYTGGVDVTTAVNLFEITFAASLDASGLFDIVVRRGTTLWTDNQSPTQMSQYFTNVPDGSGGVVIGQISVSAIPEAGGFAALALVSAVVGAWRFVKRQFFQ